MKLHEQLELVIREVNRLHIAISELRAEVRRGTTVNIIHTGPITSPAYSDPCPPRRNPQPEPFSPTTPCDEPYRVTCDSAAHGEDKCVRCESTMEMSGPCASHRVPKYEDGSGAIFPH